MSKYSPLSDFLMSHESEVWRATFSQIEKVLGFTLPLSARSYQAWWANQRTEGHVQCKSWLDAGWLTSNVNLESGEVTFSKKKSTNVRPHSIKTRAADLAWEDVLDLSEPLILVESKVEYSWRTLGRVFLDSGGRLVFPKCPKQPVVYKLGLQEAGILSVYVGETDEVSRRFQHYRTPGKTQQTNKFLNSKMKGGLANRGKVKVSVVDSVSVNIRGIAVDSGLNSKFVRRLVENLAILDEIRGGATVLNK